MVKIEKKVDRYTVKCKKCRSILSFQKEDPVLYNDETMRTKYFMITCPICSMKLKVMDSFGFLAEEVEPVYVGSVHEESRE